MFWISKTLNKFFNTQNTEIIIVDDGSTDKSAKIIDNFKLNNDYKFKFKI